MSFCPNCGAEVAREASECPACKALFAPGGWEPVDAPPAAVAPAMKKNDGWRWVLGGAAYGIFVRALFGALPAHAHGPMSAAFLVATPFVVGALSVYGIRREKLTASRVLTRSVAGVSLALLGCAVTLMEGAICLAMMAPLFYAAGIVGGIIMSAVLSLRNLRPFQVRALAVVPLFVFFAEMQVPLAERQMELKQSVQVAAPPATVWREIVNARDIRPEELPASLTHAIGVPRPVEGVNVAGPDGEVRFSRWERGVRFQGRVVERREPEYIRWNYEFDAHSFPKGSMDDHVAIGGRYFDLQDTSFRLVPVNGGTRLEIVAHYRVTSSINFYAVPAAIVLGNDFIGTILGLYKLRSEKAAQNLSSRGWDRFTSRL